MPGTYYTWHIQGRTKTTKATNYQRSTTKTTTTRRKKRECVQEGKGNKKINGNKTIRGRNEKKEGKQNKPNKPKNKKKQNTHKAYFPHTPAGQLLTFFCHTAVNPRQPSRHSRFRHTATTHNNASTRQQNTTVRTYARRSGGRAMFCCASMVWCCAGTGSEIHLLRDSPLSKARLLLPRRLQARSVAIIKAENNTWACTGVVNMGHSAWTSLHSYHLTSPNPTPPPTLTPTAPATNAEQACRRQRGQGNVTFLVIYCNKYQVRKYDNNMETNWSPGTERWPLPRASGAPVSQSSQG